VIEAVKLYSDGLLYKLGEVSDARFLPYFGVRGQREQLYANFAFSQKLALGDVESLMNLEMFLRGFIASVRNNILPKPTDTALISSAEHETGMPSRNAQLNPG